MRDSINLIIDSWIKKKGVNIWSNGKIWLPNQFLSRFGTGVGGYTY
jgi:hypothetical protein